ncbi:MAG: beta-aspartyl-peptidase [Geothrix sp.]|uniref:beta-aspartyl-peptidase n=1 Tax=Geothrix sp. TaxID=1962974 RepID=UPI003BAE46CD
MILIQNIETYAPTPMGRQDFLLMGERIAHLGPLPSVNLPDLEVIDGRGLLALPGLIDGHVHILGAGGEGGFASRTPELMLSEVIQAGVTTLVGCLGTDGITRSLAGLLAKARGLEEEGISTWIYTGSYGLPIVSLTGGVESDLLIIDKVLGVGEVAISDHRSSQPTHEDLCRLAGETRRGGMLSGKAGLVHFHLGDGPRGLAPLRRILDETEIPMSQFLPTHINRNPELLMEGGSYARSGGLVDLTTSAPPPESGTRQIAASRAYKQLLDGGVPAERVTMTSDGQGSLPEYDAGGVYSGMGVGRMRSLFDAFRDAVQNEGLDLGTALLPCTENPARILKLGRKGRLATGQDADLILVERDTLALHTVIAKGRVLMSKGELKARGTFERG